MDSLTASLVSIIIPVYNTESFLEEALESCLHQTYKPIEIIGVDNNSSDRSREIFNRYSEKYPEKIKVFSEMEKGAPAARNKGMKEAGGDYIYFLDADDALFPNAVENLFKSMENGVDVTCGGEYYYFSILNKEPAFKRERFKNTDFQAGDILYNHPNTGSFLIRKSILKSVKWDASLKSGQELVFCVQLCLENDAKFKFVPEMVCKIRIHNSPDRISNQERKKKAYHKYEAILKIEDLMKNSPFKTNLAEIALNDFKLKHAFGAIYARNFKASGLIAAMIDKDLIKEKKNFKFFSREGITYYFNHYFGFLFHYLGYKFINITGKLKIY